MALGTLRARVGAPALAGLALLGCGGEPDLVEGRPPVVLIVIDTLRADRLGAYGYELDTSPVLDELARQSYVFEANSTQCNATFASLTSIFTGLYPRTHRNYLPVPIEGATATGRGVTSLAERLQAEGYATLAAVSHPFWVENEIETPLLRGWDAISYLSHELSVDERRASDHAEHTNERLLALLDAQVAADPDQPVFLWGHYFDPHTPYAPPVEFERRFVADHLAELGHEVPDAWDGLRLGDVEVRKQLAMPGDEDRAFVDALRRALYDAEIAYCDRQIGVLFDRLREHGIFDDALIVVMSDHGENLGIRSEDEGLSFNHERLFEAVATVPLIVKLPGQREGRRVPAMTQSIDVMPTLLSLLDLPVDDAIEGRSLVPLLRDPGGRIHTSIFLESSDHRERAVRTLDLKYIDPGTGAPVEAYRWREDPSESDDVSSEVGESALGRMSSLLHAFTPVDRLHVRLEPDESPYTMSVELIDRERLVREARGASPDGKRYAFEGKVAGEPVHLEFDLASTPGEVQLILTRDGDDWVGERVMLGRSSLTRTTAGPVFLVDPDAPPSPGRFALRMGTERLLEVDLDLKVHETAELRSMNALVWGERERFSEFVYKSNDIRNTGAGFVSTAVGPGRASGSIDLPGRLRMPRLRVNGTWPAHADVRWNGRPLRSDVAQFHLPIKQDPHLTAALLAGAPDDDAEPGAIRVWLEAGGGEVAIDTSQLTPEDARLLEDLGYTK